MPLHLLGRYSNKRGQMRAYAAKILVRKHPILHGFLVPSIHRPRGNTTMHVALIPVNDPRP